MTTAYSVQTALEVLFAVALILGLVFENKIALWEQQIIKKIARNFRRKAKIVEINRRGNDDRAV